MTVQDWLKKPLNPEMVSLMEGLPEYPGQYISQANGDPRWVGLRQLMFDALGLILYCRIEANESISYLEVPLTIKDETLGRVFQQKGTFIPKWKVSPGRGRVELRPKEQK